MLIFHNDDGKLFVTLILLSSFRDKVSTIPLNVKYHLNIAKQLQSLVPNGDIFITGDTTLGDSKGYRFDKREILEYYTKP